MQKQTLGDLKQIGVDCDGVIALEFALIAPILAVALVAAIDLGFAIQERMAMDHAVRAAAQYAMEDPPASSLEKVLKSIAAVNFTTSGTIYDLIVPTPVKYCACPSAVTTAIACSTVCSGSPASIYYKLSVQKKYPSKSFIVPKIDMSSSVLVQLR